MKHVKQPEILDVENLLKVLGEHHKDRAEERAARSDAKVIKK